MSEPLTGIIEKTNEVISNGNFGLMVDWIKGIGLIAIAIVATLYATKVFAKRKYAVGSREENEENLTEPGKYSVLTR